MLASATGRSPSESPNSSGVRHLSERFRDTLMSAELACVAVVLDRAEARGDLAGRPDPRKVHSLMLGSIFAWLFMLRREPTAELVPELSRLVVRGMAAGP